jgi:hypothetical protein
MTRCPGAATALQERAADGHELLDPDANPEPLDEVRDMYALLGRELTAPFDRWEEVRVRLQKEARWWRTRSRHRA